MNQETPSRQYPANRRTAPPGSREGQARQRLEQQPTQGQPPAQRQQSRPRGQGLRGRSQQQGPPGQRRSQPPGAQQTAVGQQAGAGAPRGAPQRQQGGARPGQAGVGPSVPGIRKVEQSENYVHVRFRDPDAFGTIRTPDWAEQAARDVAPGAEVRRGRLRNSGEWAVESVLIPKPTDRYTAMRQAEQIVEKIED